MTIPRPEKPRCHPDRYDGCQMAIEDELIELVGRACDAGDEVIAAISEVTDNMAPARREDVTISIELHVAQLMKKRSVRNATKTDLPGEQG